MESKNRVMSATIAAEKIVGINPDFRIVVIREWWGYDGNLGEKGLIVRWESGKPRSFRLNHVWPSRKVAELIHLAH